MEQSEALVAGQTPRFWTWEGVSWLTTKTGLLVLVCYSCSVTRPLNDILGTNNSFALLDACHSH